MVIFTAKFSRKKLLLVLLAAAAVLALAAVLFSGGRDESETPQLFSNEDRISYLASWGWEVDSEPLETFQLLFPDRLPEDYAEYNVLQKSQGMDLEQCLGKPVTRYTYAVRNYPDRPDGVQINLYVCEEHPAAGDLVVSGAGGFRAGLAFPETEGE